jgi:hypothetical protein
MKNEFSLAEKGGYILAIIIDIIVIYMLNNLLLWDLPVWGTYLLKPTFQQCLWIINITFIVAIGSYVMFMFYEPQWLYVLMQAIISSLTWISLLVVYIIFPFNFPLQIVGLIIEIALIGILIYIPFEAISDLLPYLKKLKQSRAI